MANLLPTSLQTLTNHGNDNTAQHDYEVPALATAGDAHEEEGQRGRTSKEG
ncbi:hypothetical protein K523DRAFT_358867 [Schizophyllum commune Tattone D]|nr:hypothetical protein K523DRAFT_358867 [Schizophyllum commune Tattone D]